MNQDKDRGCEQYPQRKKNKPILFNMGHGPFYIPSRNPVGRDQVGNDQVYPPDHPEKEVAPETIRTLVGKYKIVCFHIPVLVN